MTNFTSSYAGSTDAVSIATFLQTIVAELKRLFSKTQQSCVVEGFASPTANEVTFLTHTLGKIPVAFVQSALTTGTVIATTSDRNLWTDTAIVVRSSVAEAKLQLIVFA